MRIQNAWLSIVPLLFLSAACGDARTPTAPRGARFEVGANATVASDCQTQISTLIALTQGAPITSKEPKRDVAGLVKILSDASALLAPVEKNADAVKKLTDYIAKVEQLEAAGKLDAASADQLIAGANDAIACINAIAV